MSYGIIYGEGALDALGELGLPELIEPFEAAMNRLANDPVGLGQKSSFPYPSGQQFSFACPAGPERRVGFRAHFYYDEDEQSLHVFDVRVLPFF